MERVFQAVPADLRMKMEALVQDLTNALEESSRLSSRRRWGLRRRARSTGNLPAAYHKTLSDDSSSSIGELMLSRDKGLSSLHQSDSDDVTSTGVYRQLAPLTRKTRPVIHLHGNIESDSFNENFSPVHPNTRRKRKFKRMAVDPVELDNPSTSHAAVPVIPLPSGKKKRVVKHSPNCENKYSNLLCGKRKRSTRERSVDCERPSAGGRSKTSRILAIHKMSLSSTDESHMDFDSASATHCEIMSSSSLSSSESDTGIYTNDEGREGDDEQSDWWGGDAGSVCGKGLWDEDEGDQTSGNSQGGADKVTDADEDSDPAFHAILTGSFEHLSEEAKQAYRVHMQWIREGLNGREIRAGRRRIRGERPGFSIVTSANEKLSRFLQDPGQSELRLHPMQKQELDQLCHLANLYSLQMTSDPNRRTCAVLTKTRNTMQAVRVDQVRLTRLQARLHHLSDFKRRRKMPPGTGASNMSSHPPLDVGSSALPIPETNLGNQMLRGMGWEPGTGLGAQSNGIQEPIVAAVRPKYVGLGHNPNYKSS
ncbi:G patch domain-containing protein 2 isoform X1 [Zootermopsis nevadensis]|uniref:G patch domain-containing protein 2 n=1 Tax=Zootermopsis nevadensis TaxID=136037 RepID=A0A067RGW0_ZOONE|nr:G patch domain-containing protein 2 isoform X1 [Zootermopsis nevadensis]XP_021942531.1 G patch domain-containing protein 2 isoform X1 [Zootermopsis nevadensis]KDR23012.1 G patch domain-containing protein 2 [Zootermopsis nevadensis]